MSENHHHTAAQYSAVASSERQIEATPALAYEQRTANLIAAYQADVSGMGRLTGHGAPIDRHNEILDRLGL